MTDITQMQTNLNNPQLTILLFAVLVKRLGGRAEITQTDIDAVAYNRLIEHGREDGSVEFNLVGSQQSS